MYCRRPDPIEATDRALEREANVFAVELALPEPLMRREFQAHPEIGPMAATLSVSEAAIAWRLYKLELVAGRPGISGQKPSNA
jgi:Zn-dependent peptidase ImmA (M78 family)